MSEDEPRWLNTEESEAWLALARMLLRLPAALDTQLQRDEGITHFEYRVLAGLSMSPEHNLRMSELALFAEGSLSRLSHVVKRLEKREWVYRVPDPADGRYTRAFLTEAGMAKVVEAAPGHVAEVRRLVFDVLTQAQQKHLHDIGRRINNAIGPEDAHLGP